MKRKAKGLNKSKSTAAKKIKFEHRLCLVNWMLNLFGCGSFEDLARPMHNPMYEGFGEDTLP